MTQSLQESVHLMNVETSNWLPTLRLIGLGCEFASRLLSSQSIERRSTKGGRLSRLSAALSVYYPRP